MISEALRQRVLAAAGARCGYCLSPQHLVYDVLEIEHLRPVSLGGTDEEENLWVACGMCNRYKGAQVMREDPTTGETAAIFNPRTQSWGEHFAWSADGTQIVGTTATGRATVEALNLNNRVAVSVRRRWVSVGWHPPSA